MANDECYIVRNVMVYRVIKCCYDSKIRQVMIGWKCNSGRESKGATEFWKISTWKTKG
jgi:hypothetical protein